MQSDGDPFVFVLLPQVGHASCFSEFSRPAKVSTRARGAVGGEPTVFSYFGELLQHIPLHTHARTAGTTTANCTFVQNVAVVQLHVMNVKMVLGNHKIVQ